MLHRAVARRDRQMAAFPGVCLAKHHFSQRHFFLRTHAPFLRFLGPGAEPRPPAPLRMLFLLNRFCAAKLSHSAEQRHNFVFSNAAFQKAKRRPNCNCRIGKAVVICPKVALPTVASGGFIFGMLNVLVPSTRNCRAYRSKNLKSRKMARSTVLNPG